MLCLYDSGVGGLSVASRLIQKRPNLAFTYLADNAFLPLGSKSQFEIKNRLQDVSSKVLLTHNLVVQVCNTASVNTVRYLQSEFLPTHFACQHKQVLGISKPILELVQSSALVGSRIGILATPATLKSNFYQSELKKLGFESFDLSADYLAMAIEKSDYNSCEKILKNLPQLDFDYVLLACTHYSWVIDLISTIFANSQIIDPADYIADKILTYIDKHSEYDSNRTKYHFEQIKLLTTGNELDFEKQIKKLGFEQNVLNYRI